MLRFQGWPLLVAGGVLLLGFDLLGQEPAPSKDRPTRKDPAGEPLPETAIHRFRPERVRPGDQVVAVAFSPDGKLLASSSSGQDRVLRVWDLASAKQLHQIGGYNGVAWRVLFRPDGKTLLSSGDDGTVRCWDVETGRPLGSLSGHQAAIWYSALSPDGRILASASEDMTIRLWDLNAGKTIRQLSGHSGHHWSVAFGPDGRMLASGGGPSDGKIRLWDTSIGRVVREWVAHPGGVWPLAYAPDGKTVVSAGWQDRSVRLWETATGRERAAFRSAAGIKYVALAPDCRTVACGGDDKIIHLWDVATGKERGRLEGQAGMVLSLSFSSDGKLLVSGHEDGTVFVWDMTQALQSDPFTPMDLGSKDVETLWAELASAEATKAHQAIWTLVATGKTAVQLLQERLKPAMVTPDQKRSEKKRLQNLIDQMDDDQFVTRERAMGELEKLGMVAEGTLRQALQGTPSLEVQRRIERLLEKLEGGSMPPENLRAWRALEVLEQIHTDDARHVLEGLAGGAPDDALTQEAKLGLQRFRRRPATP
jgi:hypothetical protein